jgi:hypothetical protein
MELDAVLMGEAAAMRRALQVLSEFEHCAGSGVTTGQHALMRAIDIVVMPYDDGELFGFHDVILL